MTRDELKELADTAAETIRRLNYPPSVTVSILVIHDDNAEQRCVRGTKITVSQLIYVTKLLSETDSSED